MNFYLRNVLCPVDSFEMSLLFAPVAKICIKITVIRAKIAPNPFGLGAIFLRGDGPPSYRFTRTALISLQFDRRICTIFFCIDTAPKYIFIHFLRVIDFFCVSCYNRELSPHPGEISAWYHRIYRNLSKWRRPV